MLYLLIAIILDVAGTVALKFSEGFTRLVPSALTLLLYAGSLIPLALALKKVDVGVAYALWSALGTALAVAVGMVLFRETASAMKIISLALIAVGVAMLTLHQP